MSPRLFTRIKGKSNQPVTSVRSSKNIEGGHFKLFTFLDLQGRLADYNTAIRIANGEATKQAVEEQTRELEVNNKKLQEEVELVFLEKQRKENQLRQLREQMEKVQKITSLQLQL